MLRIAFERDLTMGMCVWLLCTVYTLSCGLKRPVDGHKLKIDDLRAQNICELHIANRVM